MAKRPTAVPDHSYDDLRARSNAFLATYHPVGSIPVPIEEIIEFQFKLDIVPIEGLFRGSDMFAMVSRDMKSISIDANVQESRPQQYSYSLAHELAHILIHKDLIELFEYASIAEWKTVVTGIDEEIYATFEWQAHALASLILVPKSALKAEFDKAAAKIIAAGMTLRQAHSTDRARFMVEDSIARDFRVHRSVITDRMNREKLWEG